MKLENFFTKTVAETPKQWFIPTIDGTVTDCSLQLLGTECTAFQNAKTEYMRACMDGAGDPAFDKQLAYSKFTGALVAGWSFDVEFNEDNLINFLYNAPYICVHIDNFSSIKGNKVAELKKDSSPTEELPSS